MPLSAWRPRGVGFRRVIVALRHEVAPLALYQEVARLSLCHEVAPSLAIRLEVAPGLALYQEVAPSLALYQEVALLRGGEVAPSLKEGR